ncbi:MAG TPA: YqgE/AlgH family protein [Burkholderiales bacterium]|nr:YqgE/AlgH family protein [Burkholderiales bacterium]
MQRSFRVLLALTAVLLLAPAAVLAQAEAARTFLLVAQPGMVDPNFSRTVVLVTRPEDSGPLGVILNRPTNLMLRELYPDRTELTGRDDLVFFGGPVQPDALLFAFRSAEKPSKGLAVTSDIYISGFSEILDELLKHPENASEQRFFAGYAGWAQGQLEFEIERGGWFTLPLDVDAIFKMNPLTIYEELVKRATVPRIETRRRLHIWTTAAAGRY